jgi:hypothetical protein
MLPSVHPPTFTATRRGSCGDFIVAEASFCAVFRTVYQFSKNIEVNIIDITKLLPLMKHVKQASFSNRSSIMS